MIARIVLVLALLVTVTGFAPRAPAALGTFRFLAESADESRPIAKKYWPPSTKAPQQSTAQPEPPRAKFWPPSTKQPARPDGATWSPNQVTVRSSDPPPSRTVVSPVAAVPSHHSSTTSASTSSTSSSTRTSSSTTSASTSSTSSSTRTSSSTSSPKQRLLSSFSSSSPFVCPASLTPLHQSTTLLGLLPETTLASEEYGSTYRSLRLTPASGVAAWDLTINEEQDGKPLWQLNRREQVGSRFFQNPFISAVYERGYRQNFENAGFPGVELEWAEIREFFSDAAGSSSVVVDLSCGSGFMTRKMLQGGQYGRVVSADLSPTMLQETYRRCMEENVYEDNNRHTLIRADAARLPLASNSVDCLHAGAALHCWPRLEAALTEVHRVLKPGGKFYASTFSNSLPMVVSQRRGGRGGGGFYLFEDKEEVEGFVRGAGFDRVEGRKEGRGCVIVKAVK